MSAGPPGLPDDSAPTGSSGALGRLEGIRAAAEDIRAFAAGLDEARLLALPEADRRTFRALKDALMEVSERVAELPPHLFARHPGVDWRGWAGLRELVSHSHFKAELHRLGPAVADDVPALLAAVEAELARSGENAPQGRSAGLE